MTEKPILFTTEMMQCILDPNPARRKTQTRRIIKPQPPPETVGYSWCISTDKKRDGRFIPRNSNGPLQNHHNRECGPPVRRPYWADQLWCRETWAYNLNVDREYTDTMRAWAREHKRVWYRASHPDAQTGCGGAAGRWRPSIHMPRWACRLVLDIKSIRAERLHDINTKDIIAEGFPRTDPRTSDVTLRSRFMRAWDKINPKRAPWAANPWVWVIDFEVTDHA
jgi:hypothetical protein